MQNRWMVAGLAVGLVFLWLALKEADLGASWQVLRQFHPGWTQAVLLAGCVFIAIKSWRWSIILRPLCAVRQAVVLRTVFVGTAANLVVPHSGEILRATLLGRHESVPASAVLTTIAIERILDFMALVILAGVALMLDARVSPLLWSAGLFSLAMVLAGLVVVFAVMRPQPLLQRWSHALLGLLPLRPRDWLIHQIRRGVAGLASLENPLTVLKLVLLSVLQWICIVVTVAASAQAVGVTLPVSGAIAVFVLTVIGLTLPSSPAQLGTTQLAFVAGMELVGASGASGMAASIVYTCFVNVAMMIIGGVCWVRFSWARLKSV